MNITYRTVIRAELEQETFSTILSKGIDLGFIYLDERHNKLSLVEAVNVVLVEDEDDFHKITVKCGNTFFKLFFLAGLESSCVMLQPLHLRWCKAFLQNVGFDTERYLTLLMDLCESYTIVSLCIANQEKFLEYDAIQGITCRIDFPLEDVRENIIFFLYNAYHNSFTLVSPQLELPSEALIDEVMKDIEKDFAQLVFSFHSYKIKVCLDYKNSSIILFPEGTIKKQQDHSMDTAFYTKALMSLCESFAMQELQTYFHKHQ